MREAEESGRRQVEERIRRQEDEIFRQVQTSCVWRYLKVDIDTFPLEFHKHDTLPFSVLLYQLEIVLFNVLFLLPYLFPTV